MPPQNEQGLTQHVQSASDRRTDVEPVSRLPSTAHAKEAGPPPDHTIRQMGRRKFLLAGTATAALIGVPLKGLLGGSRPTAHAATVGLNGRPVGRREWTAPINRGLISIHAVMLHTGQVLLFSYPQNTVGSAASLWDPGSGSLTNVSLTYQRDVFCAGMERAAGRPRIHGWRARVPGRIRLRRDKHDDLRSIVQLMDRRPADVATTLVPDDNRSRRWHGHDLRGTTAPGTSATTIDHYDPSSSTITTLPSTSDKSMATYPRMKLTTAGLLPGPIWGERGISTPRPPPGREARSWSPPAVARRTVPCCSPGLPRSWRSVTDSHRDYEYGRDPGPVQQHPGPALHRTHDLSPGMGKQRPAR